MRATRPAGGTPRAGVAAVALAIAVPGLLRDVSVYFWKAGPLVTSRAGERYAPLARALPETARAGFVTDAADGAQRYDEALYALAPRVLIPRDDGSARFLVVDARDAFLVSRLCAERGLHVVVAASSGVALLERGAPGARSPK